MKLASKEVINEAYQKDWRQEKAARMALSKSERLCNTAWHLVGITNKLTNLV